MHDKWSLAIPPIAKLDQVLHLKTRWLNEALGRRDNVVASNLQMVIGLKAIGRR